MPQSRPKKLQSMDLISYIFLWYAVWRSILADSRKNLYSDIFINYPYYSLCNSINSIDNFIWKQWLIFLYIKTEHKRCIIKILTIIETNVLCRICFFKSLWKKEKRENRKPKQCSKHASDILLSFWIFVSEDIQGKHSTTICSKCVKQIGNYNKSKSAHYIYNKIFTYPLFFELCVLYCLMWEPWLKSPNVKIWA